MSMMDRVFELPRQLEWGTEFEIDDLPGDRPVVLLGMGGSAMAASVAALAARQREPLVVHRGYDLPPWAVASAAGTSAPLVVAVSYSGNTEETLSGLAAALEHGLDVVGVAAGGRLGELAAERGFPLVTVPGGLQPRAGVGYQAAAVVRVLEAAGMIDDAIGQLDEAAAVLDSLLGDGDGAAVGLGEDIAAGLRERIPVVYGGAGLGSLAAYRWKTQVNENAKTPAFTGEIPELDHNELEGWTSGGNLVVDGIGLVLLHDSGDHPRVARRIDLTEEVLGPLVPQVGMVHSVGEGPLARFFSLAIVGDVASVAMAAAAGVDATPVPTLEKFKVMLREDDQ